MRAESPAAGTTREPAGRLGTIAVALTAVLLNVPALFFPLARDQGIFAYGAAATLDGQIPYVDFVDQKPPGIHLLYAVPIAAFGRGALGIQVFLTAAIMLTALATRRAGRALRDDETGTVAGIFCALYLGPAFCGFWARGQVETFVPLAYALVFLLLLDGPVRRPLQAAAAMGLVAGACACLKPNALAFPVLALAVWLVFLRWEGASWGRLVTAAGMFSGAALFVPSVPAAWLVGAGALPAFRESVLDFNMRYLSRDPDPAGGGLLELQAPILLLSAATILGLILLARFGPPALADSIRAAFGPPGRRLRPAVALVALWTGSLAMVVSGTFLFPYHFQVLSLAGALTIALFVRALIGPVVGALRSGPASRLAFVTLVSLAALVATAIALPPEDREFLLGRATLEAYRGSHRFDHADFSYAEERELARELMRSTGPSDRVQVFGFGSLALFLADRRSATRFPQTGAALERELAGDDRYRDEIVESLRRAPPRVVAIDREDLLPQFDYGGSEAQVAGIPVLKRFLAERYAENARVGGYRLLTRRETSP